MILRTSTSIRTRLAVLLVLCAVSGSFLGYVAVSFQASQISARSAELSRAELVSSVNSAVAAQSALYGASQLVAASSANGSLGADEPAGQLQLIYAALAKDSSDQSIAALSAVLERIDASTAGYQQAQMLLDLLTSGNDVDQATYSGLYMTFNGEVLKSGGSGLDSVAALGALADLSESVITSAKMLYLPDSYRQAYATQSVAAWESERESLSRVLSTLPVKYSSTLEAQMATGSQAAYQESTQALVDALADGDTLATRPSATVFVPQVFDRITLVALTQTSLSAEAIADAKAQLAAAEKTAMLLYVFLASIIVALCGGAVFIVRSITGPLETVISRIRAIASGDGAVDSDRPLPKEFDHLLSTVQGLEAALVGVAETATALADGADPQPVPVGGTLGASLEQAFSALVASRLQLASREDMLSSVFASSSTALVTLTAHGMVLGANKAACDLFGPLPAGTDASDLLASSGIELGVETDQVEHMLPGGRFGLVSCARTVLADGHAVWVLSVTDLSERKEFENKLARMAVTDPLTQLPNRAGLTQYLEALIRRGQSYSVAFVDLDRFKLVNDTFGHAAGDELLLKVVERIRSVVRHNDVVSRLAGDEFVIVAPGLDIDRAGAMAERLVEELNAAFILTCGEARIGASIGVREVRSSDQVTAEDVLVAADLAMYAAKNSGRGRVVVWNETLAADAGERLALARDLAAAVENGELMPHYQPVFNTTTKQIEGFELLVRWSRNGQVVRPDVFIKLAEESDLIIDIGRWGLDAAAATVSRWRAEGVISGPFHIAVNISGRHLTSGSLVDDIVAATSAHGVRPCDLAVELTETSLVDDIATAAVQLQRVRDLGVSVSIDDFGTGYASLSYLSRLPVDVLKIDRSFISIDGVHADIVRTVSALAASLNLSVVAEGIETEEQRSILAELGCEMGQGYLVSPALPEARAAALLSSFACL